MKCCYLVFILFLFSTSWADLAADIEAFTGGRTKIVWARSVTGAQDDDLQIKAYELLGFDSHEGFERVIAPGPISCANPLITSDGMRVIFTSWPDDTVYISDWTGQNIRPLLQGYGLSVWNDPATKRDWIYYSDVPYGTRVDRCEIDSVAHSELVWNKSPVSIRFRVSADGKQGGGEFPWPTAGEVSLPNDTFVGYGSGCNAQIAPDNSYRFFNLVSSHKSLNVCDFGATNCRQINTSSFLDSEGITAIWAPKWTNDSRFFTFRNTNNQEIYLGKFNGDYTAVSSCLRVTNNTVYDDYAYAWISVPSQISFSPESLSFVVDTAGVGNTSQTISVANFHGILPSLSAVTSATWLSVQVTGTPNNQSIKNTVSASGLASGIYATSVLVSGSGVPSEQYVVKLRVNGAPRVDTIVISPSDPLLPCSTSVTFAAQAFDQFHDSMAASIKWSLDSGGAISSAGVFNSNGSVGRFVVQACVVGPHVQCAATTIQVYKNLYVTSPRKGMAFFPGDTMHVRWVGSTPNMQGVLVYLTLDNGRIWTMLNTASAISKQDVAWGDYKWVVPDSIVVPGGMQLLKSDSCQIRVADYDQGPNSDFYSDGLFAIGKTAQTAKFTSPSKPFVKLFLTGRRMAIRSSVPIVKVEIYDCRGVCIGQFRDYGMHSVGFRLLPGVNMIKLKTAAEMLMYKVVVP
jgi:hypothetical protein